MKTSIKSILTVVTVLVGFSSFGASANQFFHSQVTVYNGGFPAPHHRPMPVPRQPVCRYDWKYEWHYDQWGNRFSRRVQVEVCY